MYKVGDQFKTECIITVKAEVDEDNEILCEFETKDFTYQSEYIDPKYLDGLEKIVSKLKHNTWYMCESKKTQTVQPMRYSCRYWHCNSNDSKSLSDDWKPLYEMGKIK